MEEPAVKEKNHHLGVSKYLSKDRWRSRDRAGSHDKPDQKLSDDVVDFLRPSTTKARPVSPRAPRIDIAAAQRWAGNAPELRTGNAIPQASGGAAPPLLPPRDNPRKAMRRTLNLVVQFAVSPPEIIGEGGDEAESPPADIGRRLRGGQASRSGVKQAPGPHAAEQRAPAESASQEDYTSDLHPGFAPAAVGTLPSVPLYSPGRFPVAQNLSGLEDDYAPKPLRRSATGWSDFDRDDSPVEPDSGTVRVPNTTPPRPMQQQKPYSFTPVRPRPPSKDGDRFADSESAVPDSAGTLSYHLPEFESVIENSPIELIASSRTNSGFFEAEPKDRNSLSYRLIHKMRSEEGKALHEATRNPLLSDLIEDEPRLSTSTTSSYKAYSPVDGPSVTFPSTQPERLVASQSHGSAASSAPSSRILTPQLPAPSPLSNQYPTPLAQSQPPMSFRKPVPSPQTMPQQLAPTSNPAAAPSASRSILTPRAQAPTQQAESTAAKRNRDEQSNELPPLVIPAHAGVRHHEHDYRTPPTAAPPLTSTSTSAASSANQAAFDQFSERCSHMGGIFRLQAEFERPMPEFSPIQWLRCAAWWFLQGRAGMETLIRNRMRTPDRGPPGPVAELLHQPHVDLAKCKWILMEVIPTHPGLPPAIDSSFGFRAAAARERGDVVTADMFESADTVFANLKALCGSMARNNVMPPSHALIQGQDQTIWIKYPNIAAGVLSVFSGTANRSLTENTSIRQFNPLEVMAVADTKADFSYNRVFVKVSLGSQDEDTERLLLPCVVSVMRPRNEWHPKVAICTQKELITVVITGDRKQGPSWEDVRWSEQNNLLHVKMPHGYSLEVQMAEPDFKQLWSMYNHSYRVQASLLPREGEKLIFEVPLRDFLYTDSRKPPAFPPERIKRTRVRIFGKQVTHASPTGNRSYFRGLRLLAVTSPKNRLLGTASHDIGTHYPIVVEIGSDVKNDGAPAMTIRLQEEQRQFSLFMVFNEPKDRQALYRSLKDVDPAADEMKYCSARLKCLSIEPIGPGTTFSPSVGPLADLQWQDITVVNGDPINPDLEIGQTIQSSSLRTIAQAADGTVTDRINIGPGEMKLRLAASSDATITMLRSEQSDLTMIIDATTSRAIADAAFDLHHSVTSQLTLRTYTFYSLADLHAFQRSITGFTPRFDGVCSGFTIARRRPVGALSFHKKLEAGVTRLQIVSNERDKVVQLLAFFNNFAHADALGFVLKSVDVFEKVDASGGGSGGKSGKGRFGVKIVDAKFALPRPEKEKDRDGSRPSVADVARKFVCLDMPEYAAENDDITIGFDEEKERDAFLSVLPAPPQAARGMTLRRKV